jgi:hypothetical protein
MERWGAPLMEDMQQLAVDLAGASVEEGVPILVKVALDVTRVDMKLHRALLEQVPRVGALDGMERLGRRLADLLAVWLEAHSDEVKVDDPALAAHLVVQVLTKLTDHALLYRPELLTSPRFQRHLERLVRSYLLAPKSFGKRRGPSGRRVGRSLTPCWTPPRCAPSRRSSSASNAESCLQSPAMSAHRALARPGPSLPGDRVTSARAQRGAPARGRAHPLLDSPVGATQRLRPLARRASAGHSPRARRRK